MHPSWLNVAGVSRLLPIVRKKSESRLNTSLSVVSTRFVLCSAAVSTSPLPPGSPPPRDEEEAEARSPSASDGSEASASSRTVFRRVTAGGKIA